MFVTQSGIVAHDRIIYSSGQNVQFILARLLTALHRLTWRIRAGTAARLHTSHHADAPESCYVPDRGSVPRRPLCRSRQPAVGQAAQHSSDERAVRTLHGRRTVPVSYTHLTLPTN